MTMPVTDARECNAERVEHVPKGQPARHAARFGVPTGATAAFAAIAPAGAPA